MFKVLFYNFILKMSKKKKMIPFWEMKNRRKKNSATRMISVDRKGTVFPMKLKLQGELLEKVNLKKRILKKI